MDNKEYKDVNGVKAYEEAEIPYYNQPAQNAYEKARKSDFDQSGMK